MRLCLTACGTVQLIVHAQHVHVAVSMASHVHLQWSRECMGSGPVTMGVAVAVFGVFLILIFVFDIGGEDEDGPGMNSKIKIIQTHFQVHACAAGAWCVLVVACLCCKPKC